LIDDMSFGTFDPLVVGFRPIIESGAVKRTVSGTMAAFGWQRIARSKRRTRSGLYWLVCYQVVQF
jgi:hypothetical protein